MAAVLYPDCCCLQYYNSHPDSSKTPQSSLQLSSEEAGASASNCEDTLTTTYSTLDLPTVTVIELVV
ncbi:hypothetical protein Pcinc_017575 [Petrolisthes cinctipes]|uniref:Uncharacterized protein n=1 Tax=Petrolisthes cinctipes TaxID=88211 RepID=A0AAE1FTX2_PETCI|nr:hypothetical protein Pcinc_017575 [Petrolisthes cinctipes]